jgi:hypothetical protein
MILLAKASSNLTDRLNSLSVGFKALIGYIPGKRGKIQPAYTASHFRR